MRIFIILICSLFSSWAQAITVVVEPTQDNTLYESSQGALSNGSGDFIFAGSTGAAELRRAVVAFKDLNEIPDGAIITSVRFHLFLSRENSPATTLRLARLESDWGEGASDATGYEGAGAQAKSGDATWNHTFFDDETWDTPGGDFKDDDSAQIAVDGVGGYVFESTSEMVADVQHWLDNPDENFGWILLADEENTSARRFYSREHQNVDDRPLMQIEYTIGSGGTAGPDWSGPWFDPENDGEGFLIYNTPAGWLIYYFGYSTDEDRLWLVSNLVVIGDLEFGKKYEFSMLVGEPGSFAVPTPSSELRPWGTLEISMTDCESGVFILDGIDGVKKSNVTKLIGVEGTHCSTK